MIAESSDGARICHGLCAGAVSTNQPTRCSTVTKTGESKPSTTNHGRNFTMYETSILVCPLPAPTSQAFTAVASKLVLSIFVKTSARNNDHRLTDYLRRTDMTKKISQQTIPVFYPRYQPSNVEICVCSIVARQEIRTSNLLNASCCNMYALLVCSLCWLRSLCRI
jgi:hypothetical protein